MRSPIQPSYLIAGALAILAFVWIYSGQLEEDPMADSFPANDPTLETGDTAPDIERNTPSVRVAESTAHPHRAILLYTGRTEAERRAILRAETEGQIVELRVEETDVVAEDTLIVKIAPNDRFAQLAEAEALVHQREIEYDAAKMLAGKGFQTDVAKAEAEANLAAAKAALQAIRVDIARITVEAPFDGTVESTAVEVGDYVQVGDEIAEIADFDPIVVSVQVSEREISRVELGVVTNVELVSGDVVTGIISRIAASADPATRTFEVEIEVENTDNTLLDGMTAKVLLPAQEVIAHRITPALLTLDDSGQVGVKAVDGDSRVVFYPIEIVEDTASDMWIAGPPRKVTLIVVGQDFVAPGATVIAVPAEEVSPSSDGSNAPAASVGERSGDRS